MANKRVVILNNKSEKQRKNDINNNVPVNIPAVTAETESAHYNEPLDENLWGNDSTVLRRLDEKQLAERRMYVRTLYTQKIECNAISKDIASEPHLLKKPVTLMVTDISLGGIGIVSDYRVDIGSILFFKILLDHIAYEVKCEVIYCFENEGKYRAGLKLAEKDREFINHLKILVARLSLCSKYGCNKKVNF
jgi:hypothetical protein